MTQKQDEQQQQQPQQHPKQGNLADYGHTNPKILEAQLYVTLYSALFYYTVFYFTTSNHAIILLSHVKTRCRGAVGSVLCRSIKSFLNSPGLDCTWLEIAVKGLGV